MQVGGELIGVCRLWDVPALHQQCLEPGAQPEAFWVCVLNSEQHILVWHHCAFWDCSDCHWKLAACGGIARDWLWVAMKGMVMVSIDYEY